MAKATKKAKKLEVELSVLEWCNQQVADGHKLSMHWEGGGDSGWVYFHIDGKEVENEYTEYLVGMMYDQLDYGSWAGEFNAQGEAVYNKEEQAFVGIDGYSEDETMAHSCNIVIQIPKELWYDNLSISLEGDENESTRIDARFSIKNGFLSDKHTVFIEGIEEKMQEEVDNVIQNFIDVSGKDYRSIWQTITLEPKDGVIKENFIEYTIEELNIGTTSSEEKDIYLEITEEYQIPND
jgi:hypothetical protein